MLAAAELYPQIPMAMHQDHGNSVATCLSAIQNGFTSVMMDGSLQEDGKTPADFEYNVKVTAEVAKLAHARGVSVEGELGCLGSLEHGEGEQEDEPAWTRWLWPSAPATGPTSSPASRTAKCWR
jgi:fructose-bisphosphate aldolase class II